MKKFSKLMIAVTAIALITAAFAGCNSYTDWEYIENQGAIVIGWTPNPPIAMAQENNTTKLDLENGGGFDTEMALEVGKILGVEVKFQQIKWQEKDHELQSYNIDLIWNGLTVTEERAAAYELSKDYLMNNQVAVIRKEDKSKYDSLDKLKAGTKFVAESGSSGVDMFDEIIAPSSKETLVKATSQLMALTEVKAKTSNIALVDRTMAEYFVSNNDDCMVAENADGSLMLLNDTEVYAIAARKGDVKFMEKVNEALVTLYNNGTYMRLAEKYGLANLTLEIK